MKTPWIILACLLAVPTLASAQEGKNVLALETRWRAEDGARVALSDFTGKCYALTFVYTSCAGSCPLTTRKLKRLDAALEKAGAPLDLVVVSLDPVHDTPEAIKAYRARYQVEAAKRWRILVGDEPAVRSLAMLLEFKYSKNPETGGIMHDNTIYLVGPDGSVLQEMSSLDEPLEQFVAAAARVHP